MLSTVATPPRDPLLLFGQRVAALQRARGWSQERLALESGLARSYLGALNVGNANSRY